MRNLVLILESGQGLKIFAEEIEEDNRLISFKEAEELITLIEASGFSDIKAANFIIAKDGIYFVDTEFNSFAGCFGTLFRLESMVRPEDQPKIRALIDERIKIAARNKGSHSAKEEFKHMEYFGLSERRPFHFTAQQLTTDLDKEIEEQGQHLHEERHL